MRRVKIYSAAVVTPPASDDETRWEGEGGALDRFEGAAHSQSHKGISRQRRKSGLRRSGRRLRHRHVHVSRRRRP